MGYFSNFVCPVCNRTFSWMSRTSTFIDGEALCSECAKKRFSDAMYSGEKFEDYFERFDNKIISKKEEALNRKKIFNVTKSIDGYILFDDNNKLFFFPSIF